MRWRCSPRSMRSPSVRRRSAQRSSVLVASVRAWPHWEIAGSAWRRCKVPDGNGTTWRELFIASFLDGAPPELLAWVTPRIASVTRELRLAEGEKLYSVGEL